MSIVLGLLYIFSFIFGIFSSVPALERPDYLERLAIMETQVMAATFFQAAMAVVYLLITLVFYSVIKTYNSHLALWYFGFRIIGSAFLFLGLGFLPLLLWNSQIYVSTGEIDLPTLEWTAELLRKGRDIVNHIVMILPWALGGFILYYVLYQNRQVPRWLSVWGIVGCNFTLLATLFLMWNIVTVSSHIYFILNAPLAFGELLLSFFLIFRGFFPQEKGGI
ncbi:DUF4386 domain-containing protein [Gracilibacillus kekensis]|uniref:DUF4386 domain-containing protein n=1 Tax=Gracilibacillus kekensis TaxID=1027249 RepID=A0A1M7QRN8_9BACI|nr:DUF4386 domain-containing protein [Gracilibacillus kekensis]SHN33963.1 protein of unknown function [Gracilibacillus kekensis]